MGHQQLFEMLMQFADVTNEVLNLVMCCNSLTIIRISLTTDLNDILLLITNFRYSMTCKFEIVESIVLNMYGVRGSIVQ